MNIVDLIVKKRNGSALSKEEIYYIIDGYTKDYIKDYQMSAFLMAVYFRGMNLEETVNLTMAMVDSGMTLNLSCIDGKTADKHSTGGVGDKTTLIVAPMVACVGVCVAKMSGRGLGHTGGTIDKLESFEGFTTALSMERFVNNVNKHKISVIGQTSELAPADKMIYALRDVTGTIDQHSLIASSIMSKKIAAGADVIVLDVKVGSGAFMKDINDAKVLAKTMVDIGYSLGRTVYAVISDMNQPLGQAIGNNLEVIEAIQTLKGEGPKDLLDASLTLASYMLIGTGYAADEKDAVEKLLKTINDGSALDKLAELVKAQDGDADAVYNTDLFNKARIQEIITTDNEGYINAMNTEEIGKAVMMLGGGRENKDSIIDLSVGIVMKKKLGDWVDSNTPIAVIHANDYAKLKDAKKRFLNSLTISKEKVEHSSHIHGIMTKDAYISLND